MTPMDTMLKKLSPDLRREAEDFILFLTQRHEVTKNSAAKAESWKSFVKQTYGSMAGAPLERHTQGKAEVRLQIA